MKKLIIANWKMTPDSFQEARELFDATIKSAKKNHNAKIVICPPLVYLESFFKNKGLAFVRLGAQDIFWENYGSYTGEISAKMLKSLNVQYVVIGHSERRRLGETNEIVNKKIKQALVNNLKVIFCVGESERDEAGNYLQFLKDEITKGLQKIPARFFKNLIIAYEPIWAVSSVSRIGKAKFHPDTPEETREMAIYIKRVLVSLFGKAVRNIPVLYGGSVDAKNARDFLEKGDVDGLLVGRASWSAKSFDELLKNIN